MANVISVNTLNLYVKSILESNENLSDVAVEGEISGFVNHYKTGHFYFTLKDDKSSIKSVMFSFNNKRMSFMPENGMKVIVRGKVSLYERDGGYQLYVQDMFLSGIGARQKAFEQLKEKLLNEGLFDIENKKPLPKYPFKIGVATSANGAAFKDIISVAQRRFPAVEIILYPCSVQGDSSENSIVEAIQCLDNIPDIEIIIIGRGGGSVEDLWVFNSEKIARAAFACKKPTISAVGHEIDVSILDFVCDVRAATPTAAAELALPDIQSLNMQLMGIDNFLNNKIENKIKGCSKHLEYIKNSRGFNNLVNLKNIKQEKLNNISNNLNRLLERKFERYSNKLQSYHNILENQSPLNILKKGYSVVYKDNEYINAENIVIGDEVDILTFGKQISCKVTDIKKREG